jgi:hypothetical protein
MAYQIDQRKVAGVVIEANAALTGKDFNHGEVLIGLGELIGRIIVEAADTSIQAEELTKVVAGHISKTIQVGASAQEKRIITGV